MRQAAAIACLAVLLLGPARSSATDSGSAPAARACSEPNQPVHARTAATPSSFVRRRTFSLRWKESRTYIQGVKREYRLIILPLRRSRAGLMHVKLQSWFRFAYSRTPTDASLICRA